MNGSNADQAGDAPDLLEFFPAWTDKLNQSRTAVPLGTNGNGVPASPFVIPAVQPGVILPDSIDQGKRNVELTKIAGALRDKGLSEGAIYAALQVENQRICKPPLDDKEVHLIAYSVSRYKPKNNLSQVSDDPSAPHNASAVKVEWYGTFREEQEDPKEILAFHIGPGDIAMIQAATNAGKTTLLRNIALCMAAGRPFQPFFGVQQASGLWGATRAVKVAYFDFENDRQDMRRDLGLMDKVFTPEESELLNKNLLPIPEMMMNDELFQFNTHEKWVDELILKNGIEFAIVDNISAAYDLNDENSNAEVTKKIIKPLKKMARKANCAFLFAHHYGKAKTELAHAGVHAGRGASSLQALSRTVINMFGDVSKGEQVTVECAKRKTDGGQNYTKVFTLESDRWFHLDPLQIVPQQPSKPTAYKAVRTYLDTVIFPDKKTTREILDHMERDFKERAVTTALCNLARDGSITRLSQGEYCGKPPVNDPHTDPVPVKNYYEKDDE